MQFVFLSAVCLSTDLWKFSISIMYTKHLCTVCIRLCVCNNENRIWTNNVVSCWTIISTFGSTHIKMITIQLINNKEINYMKIALSSPRLLVRFSVNIWISYYSVCLFMEWFSSSFINWTNSVSFSYIFITFHSKINWIVREKWHVPTLSNNMKWVRKSQHILVYIVEQTNENKSANKIEFRYSIYAYAYHRQQERCRHARRQWCAWFLSAIQFTNDD